jgi:hypothetical protein
MSNSTYKNSDLHDAVKSFVVTAMSLVYQRALGDCDRQELNDDKFFFAKLAASDELRELPEYQSCLEALLADETFSSQLRVLAGPRGGPRFQSPDAHGLVNQFIDLGAPRGKFTFDEAHFEKEYMDLEETYYDSAIEHTAIAPLNGFIAGGPLQLSDKIEIVQLEGDAKETKSEGDLWHEKVYAISIKYSLPKAIGKVNELTPDHRRDDDAIRKAVNEQIAEVVTALRLQGIESVYVPGVIHKTSKWSFGQSRPFPGQFVPEITFSMSVEPDWMLKFKEFWKTLQTDVVQKRNFLLIAIRRFGYAHERYRSEDKIIDLLIAAEALFLSDNTYTGEIKYRLAQRSAFFLAATSEDRKIVFRRMKAAYDLRSATAHGGIYKKAFPPKSDGSESTLDDFVGQIQEYVRWAILKALHLATLPDTPLKLVEWDDLILSKTEG